MFNGKYIVFSLFALTGIVGALFIYMGPKALQTNPGVFHLGVRYADEFGVEFTRYPKGGPGATLEIISSKGELVERFEKLVMGRNLIPIDSTQYVAGNYLLRVSATDYQIQSIPAQLEHKTFSPISDAPTLNQENNNTGTYYDFSFRDNLLGVRLYPL